MAANYILELQMHMSRKSKNKTDMALECGRHIYNATLGYALRHWNAMKQRKVYKLLLNEYSKVKNSEKEEDIVYRDCLNADFQLLRTEYKLSKYQLQAYATEYKNSHSYGKYLDSNTVLNISDQAWQSIEKLIFHKSKKVHFCKYGDFSTIVGKNNKQGIRFIKCGEKYGRKVAEQHLVVWNGLEMSVKIRKKDIFAHEVLELQKVKFCKIVRKFIKNKYKYYIQLVFAGTPPAKRNSDGSFRHKIGKGKNVGLDLGTTTLATVSENSVTLEKIGSDEIVEINKEIQKTHRKLNRSRYNTNPDNYNEDGTVKRGIKLIWIRSKTYIRTLFKLKELYRLKSVKLKLCHSILANTILELGTNVYAETMNFKALAKKSKETKISEKTGRYKSKKRYGKSITNFAPASLLSIIERKLGYLGLKLNRVNTKTFKASQYNHHSNRFIKKTLNQRWDYVDKYKIQRDLYSAFLLMNSQKNLETTNRKQCLKTFDNFRKLHDSEVERLKNDIYKLPKSFGIKQKLCFN